MLKTDAGVHRSNMETKNSTRKRHFSPLDPELFNDSKTQRGLHKNCTRRDCRGSESTDERKRSHGEKEKERPLKFTPRFLRDDAIFLPRRDAVFF